MCTGAAECDDSVMHAGQPRLRDGAVLGRYGLGVVCAPALPVIEAAVSVYSEMTRIMSARILGCVMGALLAAGVAHAQTGSIATSSACAGRATPKRISRDLS